MIKTYKEFLNESSVYLGDHKVAFDSASVFLDLSAMPDVFASGPVDFSKFKNLEEFCVQNKMVDDFPISLTTLPKLEKIEMWRCQLSDIPKEIANIKTLKELNLNSNAISSIPKELFNCKKLTDIDLEDNLITEIPRNIENLESLVQLNISDNKLTTLPVELLKLNLHTFKAHNNNITTIPPELSIWDMFRAIPGDKLTLETWYRLAFYGGIDVRLHSDSSLSIEMFIDTYADLIKIISRCLINKNNIPENYRYDLINMLKSKIIDLRSAILWVLGTLNREEQEYLINMTRKYTMTKLSDYEGVIDSDLLHKHRGYRGIENLED